MSEVNSIDFSLLDRLYIPSIKIIEISERHHGSISFAFESTDSQDEIALTGGIVIDSVKYEKSFLFKIEEFKEILFYTTKSILEENSKLRIEDHPSVQSGINIITDELLERINQDEDTTRLNMYYIKKDKKQLVSKGLGIVHHAYTKDEISTFEEFSFFVNKNNEIDIQISNMVMIDHLKVINKDYIFSFYSLDDNKVFNIRLHEVDVDIFNEKDFDIVLHDTELTIEPFDKNHLKYKMIQEQNDSKKEFYGVNFSEGNNDFLYQDFRKKRLDVIKRSKERLRKEEIFQEFSDIDF